jgi:hypothetical protein
MVEIGDRTVIREGEWFLLMRDEWEKLKSKPPNAKPELWSTGKVETG